MRTIPAGEFKAKCLAIMDEVNVTGEPVLITKRGKPVARIVPSDDSAQSAPRPESIFGFLRGMVTIVGDPDSLVDPIIPAGEWDLDIEPRSTEPAS